jgi:group I intron endonuclease
VQGIYLIRQIETGRSYIGSSVNIERRWKEHRQRIKKGTHPAKHLANAFNLYGEEAFEFVVLEECDISDEAIRIERENYWMLLIQPVFNSAPVAGSVFGLKRSDEVRKRMSEAQKGRPSKLKGVPRSESAKAAISAGKKGKKLSVKHIENMKIALKGRVSPRKGVTLSDETKLKISLAKTKNKSVFL